MLYKYAKLLGRNTFGFKCNCHCLANSNILQTKGMYLKGISTIKETAFGETVLLSLEQGRRCVTILELTRRMEEHLIIYFKEEFLKPLFSTFSIRIW